MRNVIAFIICFFTIGNLYSQNMVPNPDFEITGTVPCGWTGTALDFANATNNTWTSPTQATPDIESTLISQTCSNFQPNSTYSGCTNGSQLPHSGNIYAGFYTYVNGNNWREYLQVQLASPMVVGIPYVVQLYVSLGEESQIATNNIGVGFSTTVTNSVITTDLGYAPQVNFTNVVSDTANWVFLSDTLVPTLPYEYIIIGNFYNDSQTTLVTVDPAACWDRTYYYCDDVMIRPIGALVSNTCYGDSTQFSLYQSPGVIANSWNFDDPASGPDNLSYISNPSHLFTAPGTYSVMTVGYYLNGATDTIYTTVTIGTPPFINLGSDTSICAGSTLVLYAGSGFSSYIWSDGSTNDTLTITSTNTVYVEVDNNGCLGYDTIQVMFIPCSIPGVSLMSTDTSWCDKKAIDFFDLSTNNPTSWQWYFQGAQPDTSTMQNPTGIYYPTYGSFDVRLIACNAAGCDTLFLPGFINEFQIPVAPVVTFINDTLYSSPAFSYQWYMVPNIIPGATNSYYVPLQFGDFYVVITDSNGCATASNTVLLNGIPELSNDIFRNGNIEMYVHDVTGRMVFTKKVRDLEEVKEFINSPGIFSNGIYVVSLSGVHYFHTWKMIQMNNRFR